MAQTRGQGGTERIQEVRLAQSLELQALINRFEGKGTITKGEVVDEMKRLRDKPAKAK